MDSAKYGPAQEGQDSEAWRILVVDDNHDAATMVSALLQFAGHQATTAENGLDAIREAMRTSFDAIVLDLGLPIVDGFQAAAILRQLRPAPVLIACSAWDDEETRQRTSQLGFSAHLQKPVPFALLRATLRRVMSGRS